MQTACLINYSLRSLVPGLFLSNLSLCVDELVTSHLMGSALTLQPPAGLCSIS